MWVAFLGLLGAAISAGVGVYVAKRQRSGRIDTTEAQTLWTEGTNMRKELRDELIAVRAENTLLRDEQKALRAEVVGLREKTAAMEGELAALRAALTALQVDGAELRDLIPGAGGKADQSGPAGEAGR